VLSNTVDRPRFVETEPLEIVKFICKELWTDLFAKQVDKLQTNFKVRRQWPCLSR